MSRFQNLLILFTALCCSSGSGQNYFYFHRTNHPSIYQSNNFQNVIPFQTYSAPATQATFFSSPFVSAPNYNSRPTYDPQAFHSRSNVNIIANSATYPHAYVPIREYTSIRTNQNLINPFPAQGYYSVYNPPSPAPAVAPTHAPPAKYQYVQKPLKPLQPLRPLMPLPQFLRLTNPIPNINFGNALFTQSALNAAQPNVFQIKQLYGINNEHPQVTGYSYSIGNNDKVTSTITVNFGSAKPFNTLPPLLAPVAVQTIPTVQKETETGSEQNATVSPSEVASEQNKPNFEDVKAAPELEVSSPADTAVQDKSNVIDDSKLQGIDEIPKIDADIPASSGSADTEGASVSDTFASDIADAAAESSDKAQEPIPTQEIDILLQPPSVEPPAESPIEPPVEPQAPDAEISHSEDKEPEIPDSGVSANPEKDVPDALLPEQELETTKLRAEPETELTIESEQEFSSTSTTTTSPVSADSDAIPPDYDYFTDPETAEKEAIELRSLGSKNPPESQLVEIKSEANIKNIPIETSSSESPSSTTEPAEQVKTEIVNEEKKSTATDQPAPDIPIVSNNSSEKQSDAGAESSKDKVESSTSVSMTSTTEILGPGAMTTISDRTIEISNRKVRVVIKRRVSRPVRRTRYPVVELVLPRRF